MTEGRICSVEDVPDVRSCFRSFDCLLSALVVIKHNTLPFHDLIAFDAPSLCRTMVAIRDAYNAMETDRKRFSLSKPLYNPIPLLSLLSPVHLPSSLHHFLPIHFTFLPFPSLFPSSNSFFQISFSNILI
jgi:hypothetical protein